MSLRGEPEAIQRNVIASRLFFLSLRVCRKQTKQFYISVALRAFPLVIANEVKQSLRLLRRLRLLAMTFSLCHCEA